MAHVLVAQGLSQRRACQAPGLARGRYGGGGREAKQAAADGLVREALQALVERYRGLGFWKDYPRLRKNGVLVTHKRLWRLYQALDLQLGKRRKKRRLPDWLKQPLQVPAGPNGCWSLDFTSDARTGCRRFRMRNVIDDFKRQVLSIEVDFSLPATQWCACWPNWSRNPAGPGSYGALMGPSSSAPCWATGVRLRASSCIGFSRVNPPKMPRWSASTARFVAKCAMPTSLLPCARYATGSPSGCTTTTPCARTRPWAF